MVLTDSDIRRIVELGYRLEEFAYFDGEFWRLKNVNGKCVFLDKNGLCRIYKDRPLGCRAYPVIEIGGKCAPDHEVCPYTRYITKREIEVGCKILNNIFKELKNGYRFRDQD